MNTIDLYDKPEFFKQMYKEFFIMPVNTSRTTYREHTDTENILKLRQVLSTLPAFCKDYFRAIDSTTTTKTRISYAYDIRIFFQFLLDEIRSSKIMQ